MFHLLDLCLVNANILYNLNSEQITHMDFWLSVAKGLLEGHNPLTDRRISAPMRDLPLCLTEKPFPEKIPRDTQYGSCPLCEVCRSRNKRSQTRYRCKVCKTPLHVENCLEIYHTQLHLEKNNSDSLNISCIHLQ